MAKEQEKKRPKTPTAAKRLLQSEKKRLINKNYRSQVRTAIRAFDDSLVKADADTSAEKLNVAYSALDKCVKNGIYKRNKASRTKSRLAARLAAKA